jgi:hypothetical protein
MATIEAAERQLERERLAGEVATQLQRVHTGYMDGSPLKQQYDDARSNLGLPLSNSASKVSQPPTQE